LKLNNSQVLRLALQDTFARRRVKAMFERKISKMQFFSAKLLYLKVEFKSQGQK
jgi:hypothetical protein